MGENASFQVLNISDILPNRFQPRIKFEDESLDELAESISRFGVIEPIVVRPIGNKYEIIAGERRYKASKLASKTTIPSIVISLSDKDSEELALLENVQRQSLNPIEEAVSYKRILDMGYITREELSKKIGKPQSVILNKTRLLNLADEVQSYLLNNKISERHARALLNITDLDAQVEMLHRIVNERLTVKKTNREIREYLENNKDEDTETLFDNERGNDKMDIDKILKEAHDINTETNVSNEAPNLMATPSMPSQNVVPQAIDNNPIDNNIVSQEKNKFVSVQHDINTQGPVLSGSDNVNFNNMFNNPINQSHTTDNNAQVNIAPSINPENTIPGPIPSVPVQPIPAPMDSNTSINDEISSIVSDALKNQPINNQNTAPSVTSNQEPSLDIPDFNINNPEQNNVNSAPLNPDANLVSQNIDPVPAMPDINASDINNQINSSQEAPVNPMVSPTTPIINPEPQVSVSSNVPGYAEIVQKLRACADEIEKGGHFINLEEVDLGNQYKVIFTFDK